MFDAQGAPVSNETEYANFVPAGVRRAAERANAAAAAFSASRNPEPVAEPVAEPVVEPASTTVVEPVAEPVAAPVVDWEQRYKTIQGKYNAEVPTLRSELNTLRSQVETMTAQLAVKPAPVAEPTPARVPDADVETYGEDLVNAARRWARTEIAGELDALKAQLATVTQTTADVQQETAQTRANAVRQNCMATLDADPTIGRTWRAVNDDPQFVEWLNEADQFTGVKRYDMIRDAFSRGDAARTGNFFKAYIQEHTAPQTPAVVPVHTPAPAEAVRPTLGDFASPGRGTGQAPGGAPVDKRLWTQPEIAAFYRDRHKGVFRDREAEAARLEADIFSAMREGRVS